MSTEATFQGILFCLDTEYVKGVWRMYHQLKHHSLQISLMKYILRFEKPRVVAVEIIITCMTTCMRNKTLENRASSSPGRY